MMTVFKKYNFLVCPIFKPQRPNRNNVDLKTQELPVGVILDGKDPDAIRASS